MRKLCSTLRIAATLVLARTFGRYEVSVHDYGLSYARYHWRGQVWAFPTGPIEEEVR
jgi:hypothetical protein